MQMKRQRMLFLMVGILITTKMVNLIIIPKEGLSYVRYPLLMMMILMPI